MYTTLDIQYARTLIENAERRAGREGQQARAAAERCVRSGLLRLCHAPTDGAR
jgi:hypothetical protein